MPGALNVLPSYTEIACCQASKKKIEVTKYTTSLCYATYACVLA